jgi:hypothetical protein
MLSKVAMKMAAHKVRPAFAAKSIVVAVAVVALAVLVSIYALDDPATRKRVLNWKLDGIKEADYSSDIANLIREERFDEAEKLAVYVSSNPDMPGQETVRDLREQISAGEKSKSPLKRGLGLVTGFLSGGGDSAEELLGGLLSNILISNKGLSESDLPGRSGDESDEIASALEKVNLGISGKWFPGFVRTLRRSNLLSAEFMAFLSENAAKSETSGSPTKELVSAVESVKNIIIAFGPQRALGIFPETRDSIDLEQIANRGKSQAEEVYIVVMNGGLNLLRKLPNSAEGEIMLSKIAQKGRPAVDSANFWLR